MADKGFDRLSWADYDNEIGRSKFHTTTLTAGNFAAQAGLRAALHAAIAGIVNGVLVTVTYGNEDAPNVGPAAAPGTQRESKWLVQYHDGTTMKKYKIELPGADTAVLDPNDRAHAKIGDAGAVDAFVTAFEAYAVSEVGNAVVIDEITLVGRNL
jgi:hypothetical protein